MHFKKCTYQDRSQEQRSKDNDSRHQMRGKIIIYKKMKLSKKVIIPKQSFLEKQLSLKKTQLKLDTIQPYKIQK